jgi:dihydrofolate reductase
MRRLVLKMSISIDGFVAGPHGEVDWMFRSRDAAAHRWVEDTLWQAGLHVMGSRTFLAMAGYWPTSGEALAAPMNEIPKAVFTRQASFDAPSSVAPGWAEAEVVRGELAAEMMRLKQQPGRDILAHGGADFAQSLAAAGLIDEYRLLVHPVALGKGLPLFGQLAQPLDLELCATTLFRSGVAALVYHPAPPRPA